MASLSPALGDTSRNINDDDSGNYNDRGNDRDGRNYGTVDYLCLPPDQEHHLMNIESSFHMDSDIGNLSRRLGPSPIPSNHLSLHPEEEESNTSMLNKAVPTSAPAPVPPDASSHRRSDSNFSLASDASTGAMVGGLSSPSSAPGTVTSSPTVEALARNMSRATAATSNLTEMLHAQTPSDVSERANSPRASEIGIALMHQISSTSSQGARDYSSLAHLPSRPHSAAYTNPRVSSANRPISKSASASTLIPPPSSIASSNGTRKPKFLRSRNSSQRSSISSLASDMNDQDDDYASTVTGMGAERRPLSRQASLGSIASGITGLMAPSTVFGYDRITASSSAADRNLARLDEEERNSGTGSDDESAHPAPPANTTPSANSSASSSIVTLSEIDDKDRPHTPKERAPPLPNPTETAITAQVGNVKVPPTAKREYSKRLGIHLEVPGSPSKKAVASAGTPATGRGREMTLKEQTASIDRLQKENFDLKIKVYYLNEKLEKMSDEGIKEAMKENIDLKVRLAEGVRERKQLKKRIRDLEKQVEQLGGEKEREEEASAAAESEEIWELKERIERYEAENVEFRRRDAERNERLRDFRRQANGHQINEEQLEQLRDLLTSEQARREAHEAENLRLREEVYRLRSQDTLLPSLSRATSRSVSDRSESRADRNLISQLTQAQRENDELRREVSAQTSMLTSRNREKERLYAEIEDLKLTMRGGGLGVAVESASRAPSVFSDRGLDRSVSRAGGAASATGTNVSAVTENEREDFENTNGALRDRISELRLKNQDLEQQVEACFMEIEQRQIEMNQLEDELEVAHAEVQEMQLERNDALKMREEIEQEFQQLKEEAEDELHRLEDELDARTDEVMRFQEDGRLKDEDFGGLQQELRNVSDIVVRLEDQQEAHHIEVSRLEGRIQELERTIHEGEQEMSVLENSLREANEKIERLTVQSESAKGEIAFLREEQDVDKIKIGELHGVISKLEAELEDEKDKVHEAQEQMETEREKREQHGDQRKQEWERRYEERSEELTKSKEEVRKLKTKVCSREDEARNWRERLEELERGLRDALGDLGGTKLGLAQAVVNLQAELDGTLEELDFTKNELTEKDRNLKERENLLESMALENRKLTDLLEKERNSHRQNKSHLETLQSSHHHTSRRITQHQQQQSELEKQRNRETKNLKNLEDAFREQLTERNNLLMQIWQRLSAVCGKDWANRNAMVTAVNTGKLPMDSAIISAFPAFSRNLISAVKTIESIVAGFKTKCRGVERDLWKEYQVVESALEARTRRIERLEGLIRGGMGETNSQVRSEIAKLRSENRMLKVEINVMKQDNAAASAAAASAAAQNIPNSPSSTPSNFNKSFSEKRSMQAAAASAASSGIGATPPTTADSSPALPASKSPAIGSGHHRNSSNHGSNHRNSLTAARNDSNGASGSGSNGTGNSGAPSSADGGEKRWILRLRELEKRLKQEREARMLDRSMANKKIQETKGEKEEIRRELERERIKSEK